MSFILDALKKSEAERQRQAGPTLLELRVTQPHRRYPAWALLVGALLAVNAAVLLWVLLRHPVPPAAVPPIAVAAAAPADLPAPRAAASGAPDAPVAPPTTGAQVVNAVPQLAPSEGSAAGAAAAAQAAAGTGADAGATTNEEPGAAAAAAGNPADEEPAVPASGAPPAGDYSSLPSLSSLGGDAPALQLDLLDYSDLASERYALINMHRVHEGDVLPEGARVLAILRDGVAMDYRGQSFMLRPSGATPQTPP